MRLPPLLSRYIGRNFVIWFLYLLCGFLAIIFLLEHIELLRRGAGKPEVTFALILEMTLLKIWGTALQIFPFLVLFSAMYTFWRLTRSQELIVVRAVGVSAWQFLTPVLAATLLIGVIKVTVINPASAAFTARYERLEDEYLKRRTDAMTVSRNGLWVRQIAPDRQYLIHAEKVEPATRELKDVIVFFYDGAGDYTGRMDAPSAWLRNGRWEIHDAWLNKPNEPRRQVGTEEIPTELTFTKIQESFAPPETLSFWRLPGFIQTLEATGFSAVRHRLYFQSLLAQPLLLCAMVLFAAAFSLRQSRRGHVLIMISAGVVTGLVFFVLSDVVLALGNSETIPVGLAAWAPPLVSLMLGVAALLHLEDG